LAAAVSCLAVSVYPRVCGGTTSRRPVGQRVGGLSPRVRGNLMAEVRDIKKLRSIPACAGEPEGLRGKYDEHNVTPGLSPRVRGNLPFVPSPGIRLRSIPACAGEPPPAAP
jgi:hypothetical protein